MTNPVAQRLLNQQLLTPQFSHPEEVVSHFGAMQAQDYKMMRWAVSMRTKKPSVEAFRKAFDSGKILRVHLLRCTWQLIAAEDHGWMSALCGARARQAMNGWMHSNKIYISDEEKYRIREYLVEALSGKTASVKEDIVTALAERGVLMDDHRLSYHIRMAELDAVICSGDLHPSKATYALVSERIGPQAHPDRDEALLMLARKYFRSHSPATLEDFVWWSGLGVSDCRKAVAMLGSELHATVLNPAGFKGKAFPGAADSGPKQYYILGSCRTRGFRKGSCLLIPPYDEYLIAYKSREVSLERACSHRAHNNSGIFYPVAVKDGIVCANWKPLGKSPELALFDGYDAPDPDALASEWSRYSSFRYEL